ncbi:2797_t:CDS:2, partial [Funneliformis mosseae]
MISASSACIIRVPTEVVKQRMQTKQYASTSSALKIIFKQEGLNGFYHGYFNTIPFTCFQFPLYEYLKILVANNTKRNHIEPWEAAICGSISGGFAAAITTPLDHQTVHNYSGTINTFNRILHEEGFRYLFSGIGPRVIWMSI